MSDDGEWIEGAILDDWRARDEAKNARISALEAALAKADELAEQCDDAFCHLDGVGLPEFYHTLTAYRAAREATR